MSNYNRIRRSTDSAPFLAAAALILFSLAAAGYQFAGAFANEHTATCTVTSMDRGAGRDDASHYRVYTEDCGVLVDDDSWLRGKVNSADLWAQIRPGQRYEFKIAGFRFPLASQFPNILAVQPPR